MILTSQNLEQTREIAQKLSKILKSGDIVALYGTLGVGKTEFCRALIQCLTQADIDVPSPTFTLIQTYDAKDFPIYHFDMYRLKNPSEVDELGFDDIYDGLTLIEWPEKIGKRLPKKALSISIDIIDGIRQFKLCEELSSRLFLNQNFLGKATITPLPGDASHRHYLRVQQKNKSFILMVSPSQEKPKEFVLVDDILLRYGLSVPVIYNVDLKNGLILMEDFGENKYANFINAEPTFKVQLFKNAIDAIIQIQTIDDFRKIPPYGISEMIEHLKVFLDWYMVDISDREKEEFIQIWQELLPQALEIEQGIALWDFHVDNLMYLKNRVGYSSCGLLDFQDASITAISYDLVSLLEDVRQDMGDDLRKEMIDYYIAQKGITDIKGFMKSYHILSVQRNMRILGFFARLYLRDKKEKYLSFIPYTWKTIYRHLDMEYFKNLNEWLKKHDKFSV